LVVSCLLNIIFLYVLNYSCANCYLFNRIHWLPVSHNITLFMLLYLLSNKDVITIRAIYFFLNFLFMLSCLNRSYATDVNSSIFAGINNVYIMFMHFVRFWCLLFISAEWSLMELPHPFLTFCFRIYFH
jgi:hypothetical protein